MDDLERELSEALHHVLDPIAARPVPDRRTQPGRSAWKPVVRGAGAALALKALAGAAVAVAAVTAAGAVSTGSLNPAVWERQASHQVTTLTTEHSAPTAAASSQPAQASGNKSGTGTSTGGSGGSSQAPDGGNGKNSGPSGPSTGPEPVDPVGMHPPVRVTPAP